MTLKQLLKKMTKEEKQLVEGQAFGAALAMANYWDALRTIEEKYGVEFDSTVLAIETLAASCDAPASLDDFENMSAEDVMEMFVLEDSGA